MSNQINDIPEGFKLTELGVLPEEWQVVSLGDVLTEVDRRAARFQGTDAYKLPVLSLTKNYGLMLQSERFGKRIALEDVSDYKVVKCGEIVYNPYVIWEGAVHILDRFDYGLVSPVYPVLETNPERAEPYFLDSILRTPLAIAAYNRFAAGAVNRRRSIRRTDFMAIQVPLPPLPEQKAIARVLSTIQRAIKAQDKIIAAARELKKSLMRHLFTYGPVPVAEAEKVPLKDTEIGPVPEHWEVVRLGEVTEKTKQFDPRRNPTWMFKYVDVSCISSERLRIENSAEYSGSDAPHRARKVVSTDDIIFATVRSYLRRVAMVPEYLNRQMCSTAFCIIRCKRQTVEPSFVFQAVTRDSFVASVSENQRGSSYPAVTDKDVLRQLIPLPPVYEQRQISRILTEVDKKIEAEEKRKAALQALFKTMLHLLMTGKVKVKDVEAQVS